MIATILCFGEIKVVLGQLSIGALVTFNIFSQRFITPITSVYRFPTEILDYKLSWIKIKEKIIETDILEDVGEEFTDIDKITFSDVSFKYSDIPILKKCEFQLKTGNMYALVGISGSGKSTIVKLILRLGDRYKGDICINNKDIRTIKIDSLRNKISYISQEEETSKLIEDIKSIALKGKAIFPEDNHMLEPLTKSEIHIVKLYSNGLSRKELAKELNTNVRSMAVSLSRIYQKLGVRNYQEMIDKVRELGYVDSF